MGTITLKLPDNLTNKLPKDESAIKKIVELGLKQLQIENAIKKYKKDGISLAKAAELAGVSIREMVSIAYAFGVEPKNDETVDTSKITKEAAINL